MTPVAFCLVSACLDKIHVVMIGYFVSINKIVREGQFFASDFLVPTRYPNLATWQRVFCIKLGRTRIRKCRNCPPGISYQTSNQCPFERHISVELEPQV